MPNRPAASPSARDGDDTAARENTAEPDETLKEKSDRQYVELLNEIRVALPGAQFLFAFLLTVPFAARFASVSRELRLVFFGCLLCTLLATILLMAPTAYHRVRWGEGNKAAVIRAAHRMFLTGLVALAVSMTTAVGFVSYVLLGTGAALAATAASAILLGLTWYAIPLHARLSPYD